MFSTAQVMTFEDARKKSALSRSISPIRDSFGQTLTSSSGMRWAHHTAPGLPLSGVQSGPTGMISKIQTSLASATASISPPSTNP